MSNFNILIAAAATSIATVPVYAQQEERPRQEDTQCMMPAGVGVINSIDAGAKTVNITHIPIPAIGWPKMTMDFATGPHVDLGAFGPNDHVQFMLHRSKNEPYQIVMICETKAEEVVPSLCMEGMKMPDMPCMPR